MPLLTLVSLLHWKLTTSYADKKQSRPCMQATQTPSYNFSQPRVLGSFAKLCQPYKQMRKTPKHGTKPPTAPGSAACAWGPWTWLSTTSSATHWAALSTCLTRRRTSSCYLTQ